MPYSRLAWFLIAILSLICAVGCSGSPKKSTEPGFLKKVLMDTYHVSKAVEQYLWKHGSIPQRYGEIEALLPRELSRQIAEEGWSVRWKEMKNMPPRLSDPLKPFTTVRVTIGARGMEVSERDTILLRKPRTDPKGN